MASVFKAGLTAVISGGASGIGLSLAKKCSGYGMKVLIADVDEESLASAGKAVGGDVTTFKMDVGKMDDWAKLKSKVDEQFSGQVNLLALNAGIGPKSSWEDVSVFHKIMETNLFGVINGVSTFLPAIQAKATADAPAAVIITGSKQGITNPPGNPAYNASKAAVKTLAEHLSFDTRDNPAIAVHLLVPGWVHTNLTGAPRGAQEKPAGSWWPDQIADFLEQKMAAGQFYVMCPDEDVSEDTDRKRMLWAVGDVNERRPPLSRWRAEWKAKAQEWMDKQKV